MSISTCAFLPNSLRNCHQPSPVSNSSRAFLPLLYNSTNSTFRDLDTTFGSLKPLSTHPLRSKPQDQPFPSLLFRRDSKKMDGHGWCYTYIRTSADRGC